MVPYLLTRARRVDNAALGLRQWVDTRVLFLNIYIYIFMFFFLIKRKADSCVAVRAVRLNSTPIFLSCFRLQLDSKAWTSALHFNYSGRT